MVLVYCLLTNTLFAERSSIINFYYTVNNQIQEGNLRVKYDFYKNDSYIGFPEVVRYDDYENEKLDIKSTISTLKWDAARHEGAYRLAFGNTYNTSGKGLTKASTSNYYLRSISNPKEISYSLYKVKEVTTTAIVTGFVVVDNSTSFDDVAKGEFADSTVLGFGFHIEPVMLIPEGYEEVEPGKVDFANMYLGVLADNRNSKFEEWSYRLASYIRDGEYEKIKMTLLEINPTNANIFNLDDVIIPKKVTNYDLKAFQEASGQNRIRSYRTYLEEYPNGKYADQARSRILALTPFKINIVEREEDVFMVNSINFLEGVGSAKPTDDHF